MAKTSRDRIDYAALAQFRYEIRRFLNFSETMSLSAGLEPQQHQALLALRGLPSAAEATVSVLADRMLLRHNSAVELADRLEARHLLQRVPSATDARQVLLQLTPRGNRALEKVSRPHRARLQTAGPLFISALQAVLRHASRRKTRGRAKRSAASRAMTQRVLPKPTRPQRTRGDR
jgi:DNA-binding MarR family transcriptional regulator